MRLYGGLGALGAAVTGNDIGQAYQENRDLIRGIDTSFREEYPKHGDWHTNSCLTACDCLQSFTIKNIKFSINRTAKTGQLLANTGRAAATGAMYGGISGAGRSEADTADKVLNDAQNAALTKRNY